MRIFLLAVLAVLGVLALTIGVVVLFVVAVFALVCAFLTLVFVQVWEGLMSGVSTVERWTVEVFRRGA
jgi:hypothetical protein